jgi:hypothetical protein
MPTPKGVPTQSDGVLMCSQLSEQSTSGRYDRAGVFREGGRNRVNEFAGSEKNFYKRIGYDSEKFCEFGGTDAL